MSAVDWSKIVGFRVRLDRAGEEEYWAVFAPEDVEIIVVPEDEP